MKHGPIRATPGALDDEQLIAGEAPHGKRPIPWFRFVDRVEQLEYLLAKGLIDPSFGDTVARFRSVLDAFGGDGGGNGAITVPGDLARGIETFCDSFIHYVDAPAVPSGAINDRLDFNTIENEFLSSPAPVVCLDDFLGPEALQELRRFCLEATIYFGSDAAGFVSSNVTNGFNCGLLYQIAEALKRRLPRVIGSQFLTNMWVYRHQAQGKGVHAHTDDGAVTFNFWITPDAANVDADRGGLVVYKKEQPLDWDWMEVQQAEECPTHPKTNHNVPGVCRVDRHSVPREPSPEVSLQLVPRIRRISFQGRGSKTGGSTSACCLASAPPRAPLACGKIDVILPGYGPGYQVQPK